MARVGLQGPRRMGLHLFQPSHLRSRRSEYPSSACANLKPSPLCDKSATRRGSSSPTMPAPSSCAASPCAAHPGTNSSTPDGTASSFWKSQAFQVLAFRRSEQTALVPYSSLGWAEISHPFHPLRGRRFEVLKKRRRAGVDTLILRELERGTLSIPREWTDWADPSPYNSFTQPSQRLAADCLFELVALLEALAASSLSAPGPGKDPQKSIDKGGV